MGKSLKRHLAEMPIASQLALLDTLDIQTLEQMAREEWWFVQRPEQVPPPGAWTVHLYLAGRGCGKTRSGAEWLVQRSIDFPYDASGFPTERLVVAYNLSDTRIVCIEGASGVLRVLNRRGFQEVKDHYRGDMTNKFHYTKSPKPHITLMETGAKIHFTGADPDAPRGFNLADAWLDEPVKWEDPMAVWKEGIFPALRADLPGDKPRAFVTTTPKPIALLQYWLGQQDGTVSMARGSTFDNADNLSEAFLVEAKKMYEGTALGRQELYGEMLDSLEGMLFSYMAIHGNRVQIGPTQVAHRTVGVDPGLTGAEEGDEMGVVVVCRDAEDHMFVVADETTRLAGREAALHAWRVFERYQCDTLVYESNLGKAWMHEVFLDAFKELQRSGVFSADIMEPPLVPAFSTVGKKLRAEPVAMRYSQGRVHHIGMFEKLEAQMLSFDPITSKVSPDRLDALVHACRHLIDGEKRRSKILSPANYPMPSLGMNAW